MIKLLTHGFTGFRLAAVTIVSISYGWLILAVLPFWTRMETVQGGPELQTRMSYSADEAHAVLAALSKNAKADAFAFYAIDIINAVLFALSLGALIALGLRLLGHNAGKLRWLVLLPVLSGVADIAENASLATALALYPQTLSLLSLCLGPLTGFKLLTGYASITIMLLLLICGLIRHFWKSFGKSVRNSN